MVDLVSDVGKSIEPLYTIDDKQNLKYTIYWTEKSDSDRGVSLSEMQYPNVSVVIRIQSDWNNYNILFFSIPFYSRDMILKSS